MTGIFKRVYLVVLIISFFTPVSSANRLLAIRQALAVLVRNMSFNQPRDLVRLTNKERPDQARILLKSLIGFNAEIICSSSRADMIARKLLGLKRTAQLLPVGIVGGTAAGYVVGRHGHSSEYAAETVESDIHSSLPSFIAETTAPDIDGIVQESSIQLDSRCPIESTRITHVVESGIQATQLQPRIEIPEPIFVPRQTDSLTVQNESCSLFKIISDYPVIIGTIITCAIAAGVWYVLHDTANFIALREIIGTILNGPTEQTDEVFACNKKAALKYAGKNNLALKERVDAFFSEISLAKHGDTVEITEDARVAVAEIIRLTT